MTLHRLDPLHDVRWPALVDGHSRGSIFHTRGWLDALHRTYGYEPIVFSRSAAGQPLQDTIVFCDVRSWLTGRRLVSLPFSDHCEPLVDGDALPGMCADLQEELRQSRWRYVELRPCVTELDGTAAFTRADRFCLHLLDLRGSEASVFARFHRTSTQQMIRRAEREHLGDEAGRGDALLRSFYALLALTRRRHRVPPQPFAWFRNLASALGEAMTVRIATASGRPVAGIVTLRHQHTMTFKYAASDAAFHRLGSMQLLLWRAIQEARAAGCTTLDLGRSSLDHSGLRVFKDRWGATRSELTYWRYPRGRALPHWAVRSAQQALRRIPASLMTTAGTYFYKHAA